MPSLTVIVNRSGCDCISSAVTALIPTKLFVVTRTYVFIDLYFAILFLFSAHREVADTKSICMTQSKTVEEYSRTVRTHEQRMDSLTSELHEAKLLVIKETSRVQELSSLLQKSETAKMHLTAEMAEKSSKLSEVTSLRGELVVLKSTLAAEKRANESLSDRLAASQQMVSELESKLYAAEMEVESCSSHVEVLSERLHNRCFTFLVFPFL